ncbi:VWA domain-containing protein [Thalassobellus sediminis]|uniref:VWA domain-containing protein n=1 Tax=Thalassobellus sediminis TaxID=3367753 RepID=UPI0037ADF2C3
MSSETIIYIILAGIIALLLALFQYFKKEKSMSKLNMLFSFLRFLTIFSVLLLLINPKFNQIKLSVEKPNLVVAIDNSNSTSFLKQDEKVRSLIETLSKNKEINNKFNLNFYTFGESLQSLDSLTFLEKQTNIYEAFNRFSEVYRHTVAPTLLITDGNQTYGNDYEFSYLDYKQPIFPIILGDTVVHTDLKIEQLNVNKYAYLKNKFPVESIVVYNGNAQVESNFIVKQGNTTVYSEVVSFSKNNNSKLVSFTLPASTVGVNSYKATLIPIKNEKNTVNNSKNFAVEVIDQKTKIAIVHDFLHPDLGVFKKSIESNEQRSVTFLSPNEIESQINDFQLIMLYQPNRKFKDLFNVLNKENKNLFVIEGSKTDLNFLNSINTNYQHEVTQQTEVYQAELNSNYTPFIIDDINFESFPPLTSNYGYVNFSIPFESILNKSIRGVATNEPLLMTFEKSGRREAVLFGENIWQWRAQNFINSKSFNQFDDFIGKLIQYLASNKRRHRLNLEYNSFYNGSTNIIVKAQYFDKNYEIDTRESLSIFITDEILKTTKTLPLILNNNYYQVDLSSLSPSKYNFTVRTANQNISKSGQFEILEYNVEQQFLNANVTKLEQLATNSKGNAYFIDKTDDLINDLLADNRYVSIQKSNKNSLPLIDWKYLLAIIAISLVSEWFLRKYNGLI